MTNTRAIRWVALSLASLGFAAGLIALLGWATDLTRLADWDGDGIAMQPNTALAAACAGAALLVGRRRPWLVALLALVCLAIGGATLYEHISGRDLHIDRLLFDKPWGSAGTTSQWVSSKCSFRRPANSMHAAMGCSSRKVMSRSARHSDTSRCADARDTWSIFAISSWV